MKLRNSLSIFNEAFLFIKTELMMESLHTKLIMVHLSLNFTFKQLVADGWWFMDDHIFYLHDEWMCLEIQHSAVQSRLQDYNT